MKKIILLLFISSFLLSQSLTKGWYNDDFEVPGKLTADELEVLGGTPGVGKVLTDDGTGAGIAIWTASVAGFADPMTTRGDIIYRDATNVTARLGLGANTFVLGSDGTDASWTDLSGTYQPLDGTLTAFAGLTIGANQLIYGTGADAFSMLGVNATATNKFLRQVSSGVPAWAVLVAGDIPDISATYESQLVNSAGLSAALNDETGTGLAVFSTTPTFTTNITTPLVIGGTSTTQDLSFKTTSGSGASGADMHFLVGSNGATEAMTILNSGNVGIGTASPLNQLHILGSGRATGATLRLQNSFTGSGWLVGDIIGKIMFHSTDASNPDTTGMITSIVESGGTYPSTVGMGFITLTGGVPAERIRITGGGNVGIGTTAPGNPLAVNRSGDGVIVDFESADVVEGNVSISGNTTSYNAFVGSHYTQLKTGQVEPPIGAVVVSTGEIIPSYFEKKSKTKINKKDAYTFFKNLKKGVVKEDSLYFKHDTVNVNMPNKEYFVYVSSTSIVGDKRVYGTWLGKMSDDAKNMSFGEPNKPVYLVAQVGLFKILVTEDGGNIGNGDYLETSIHPYLAQKQMSSYKSNSTVAKAMINVDWSKEVINPDFGVKVKLIPCTY